MMRLLTVIAVLGLAAVPSTDDARPAPASRSVGPAPASHGTGPAPASHGARLVVREARAAEPLYIEGSVGYLRIVDADAGTVVRNGRARTAAPGTTRRIFRRVLPPGRYRIVSYQRPCDGNCDYLDGPTERYAATVKIRDGEPARVTFEVTPGAGRVVRPALNDSSRPEGRLARSPLGSW
jgi:hypothetical protein